MRQHLKVINLFGGPGAGKSTLAASLFAMMKQRGMEVELALEYAKDLVYDKVPQPWDQAQIFNEQLTRISRYREVDWVVTDSPLMLSAVYGNHYKNTAYAWHLNWPSYNYYLPRYYRYNPSGRNQETVTEAEEIDDKVQSMLATFNIPYKVVPDCGDPAWWVLNDLLKRDEAAA